ncbi:MAG: nicotinate-nucleotide adenylyltransferase [Desulfuromonas sp.]|nr:nicotinate-nucleotide adenylyltransferase [Desulfuromonas sp.]
MKTGIIGGTFNPIHNGHLLIAQELLAAFQLDRVLFIPAASPPHKSDANLPPFAQRMEMVTRAIADRPAFQPCDIESRRSGKSYSVHTLEQLQQLYPDDEFYFLIGMDSLHTLHSWHEYRRLFELCHLVVARRPGSETPASAEALPVAIRPEFCYDSVLKTFCHQSGHHLYFLEETFIDISSTEIRRNIEQNRPIDTLVPTAVNDYIQAHHLYAPAER